ncbi:MAG TPA: FHA domain-containing protein [Actinomycetes bacterium]|nr:FHA domain-containing protein [Actinomycetes bacterium]
MASQQPGSPEQGPPEQEPPEPEPRDHTSTLNLGALGPDADVEARLEAEAPEEVQALAPGTALLVVQRGPNAGSRYLLDSAVTSVGRHPDSDIFLDDVTVSRRHAEFRRDASGFRVVDVGSLNGTYVNRHRIDDVVLAGGDEVQVGKYRLLFLAGVEAGTS